MKKISVVISSTRAVAAVLGLLLAALAAPSAQALDPVFLKLANPTGTPHGEAEFGTAVALNETYLLVGEPYNSDDGPDADSLPDIRAGAVHVYRATTGAFVRTLRPAIGMSGAYFGTSVAIEGKLAVVGAPSQQSGQGAAYVFDVTTGKLLQTLTASDAPNNDGLGVHVAVQGTRALVSTENRDSSRGAVYIYDDVHLPAAGVRTQSRLFTVTGAATQDGLGPLAMHGTLAAAGAPGVEGSFTNAGAVYLFDTDTAQLVQTLTPAVVTNAGWQFGRTLAFQGGRLLIGSPGFNDTRGAIYVFDARTGTELHKLTAPDGVAQDRLGISLASQGNLVLVGIAQLDDIPYERGALYAFDLTRGTFLAKLVAPDGRGGNRFGCAVALHGTRAVAGAVGDDPLGVLSGSAYVIAPLQASFPLPSIAAKKNFAPNVMGTTFAALGESAINDNGAAAFAGTVQGAGVTAANNRGVWTDQIDDVAALSKRSGVAFTVPGGTASPAAFSNLMGNGSNFFLYQATLTGPGAASGGSRVLLGTDGYSLTRLLQLGHAPTGFSGGIPLAMPQVVQSMFTGRQAVVSRFRIGSGTPAVTAASDTGILLIANNGSVAASLKEGAAPTLPSIPPLTYGQFSRASFQHQGLIAAAGLVGDPLQSQGLVIHSAGADAIFLRRGESVTNPVGLEVNSVTYSTFTGETTSFAEEHVFRATIKGSFVTAANNEGLWWLRDPNGDTGSGFAPVLCEALHKGEPFPGLPTGVTISQFVQFWALDVVDAPPMPKMRGQILLLATLRGTGVNTGNDRALCLLEEANPLKLRLLMREGDFAPGCGQARIGAISRVIASPYYATYAVQVTLAGAPASSNLALYRGTTALVPSSTRGPLRRPFLALRKGTVYQGTSGNATLTSFTLPSATATMDATGAGGKGLGLPINRYGEMTFTATFSDGSVRLVKGAL